MFRPALGFAVIAMAAITASAATLADDVVASLYSMKGIYSSQYAPAAWKKQHAAYDLDIEFKNAINHVQANPQLTVHESRKVFKNFIYAMRDYHVGIDFASTESASIPLRIKSAQGRTFLIEIDRAKLSTTAFPFEVGDELVSVDGKAIEQAITDLQAETTENVVGTDRSLAEYQFFRRSVSNTQSVPRGPVNLGIRRKGASAVTEVQLLWNYTPERVAPRGTFTARKPIIGNVTSSLFNPMMTSRYSFTTSDLSQNAIGARQSFIPALGTKVWESTADNTFYAYIFKTDDRKLIGYVRIPSYVPPDAAKAISDFAGIVQRFEQTTDSLVIDQVNNPGGSVFYLYALASMLTEQPLKTPRHRMTINQADILDALTMVAELDKLKTEEDVRKAFPTGEMSGYPVTLEFVRFMKSYAQFLIDEWNAGRRLSEPYWIAGVDQINPAATRYTKPIMVVVNELDFSGGDFFPTILQDNKRVTVFGARTAGAGGYVNTVTIPNNVGILNFSVTGSIAERVDGNPIENLGVTPDIPYALTADDVSGGYRGYAQEILGAIKKLTP